MGQGRTEPLSALASEVHPSGGLLEWISAALVVALGATGQVPWTDAAAMLVGVSFVKAGRQSVAAVAGRGTP